MVFFTLFQKKNKKNFSGWVSAKKDQKHTHPPPSKLMQPSPYKVAYKQQLQYVTYTICSYSKRTKMRVLRIIAGIRIIAPWIPKTQKLKFENFKFGTIFAYAPFFHIKKVPVYHKKDPIFCKNFAKIVP